MKFTGMIECFARSRDRNGNTYHAVRFTDFETGRTAHGTLTADNADHARRWLANGGKEGDWADAAKIIRQEQTLPAREFDRMVKNWPHVGCTAEEIAAALLDQIHVTGCPNP